MGCARRRLLTAHIFCRTCRQPGITKWAFNTLDYVHNTDTNAVGVCLSAIGLWDMLIWDQARSLRIHAVGIAASQVTRL